MEKSFKERVIAAHDIECPKCGSKADVEFTTGNTFNSLTCCHQELEDLLHARLAVLSDAGPGLG